MRIPSVRNAAACAGVLFSAAVMAGYILGLAMFRPDSGSAHVMPEIHARLVPTPGPDVPLLPFTGLRPEDESEGVGSQSSPGSGPVVLAASSSVPAVSAEPPPGAAQPPVPSDPPAPGRIDVEVYASLTAISQSPPRFHVQVGSFEERESAEALVRALRARGYAVHLAEGMPYRVWVGGYLDQATAERLSANLRKAGFEAQISPSP